MNYLYHYCVRTEQDANGSYTHMDGAITTSGKIKSREDFDQVRNEIQQARGITRPFVITALSLLGETP